MKYRIYEKKSGYPTGKYFDTIEEAELFINDRIDLLCDFEEYISDKIYGDIKKIIINNIVSEFPEIEKSIDKLSWKLAANFFEEIESCIAEKYYEKKRKDFEVRPCKIWQ